MLVIFPGFFSPFHALCLGCHVVFVLLLGTVVAAGGRDHLVRCCFMPKEGEREREKHTWGPITHLQFCEITHKCWKHTAEIEPKLVHASQSSHVPSVTVPLLTLLFVRFTYQGPPYKENPRVHFHSNMDLFLILNDFLHGLSVWRPENCR